MAYAPVSNSPQWTKVTKTFTDFATAGLTNDIEILSLPAKGVVHSVMIKHTAAFTGGLIATYTLSVGITGTLAKYVAASNVFQAPSNTLSFPSVITPIMENSGAVTSVRAAAISTVGNLNAATTGSVDFYILVSTLPA